jgi:hypothetical protein
VTTLKVDNAKLGRKAKIEIRRNVLAAITPARAIVFDAFAGTGVLWGEVWREAAGYVGCDEQWHKDPRCCFVADNRRVMRTIDLNGFTVFDFDAYGSPWDQLGILVARRRRLEVGERLGLVVTEGTWIKTRTKDPVGALRAVLPATVVTPIPASIHDDLIRRALVGTARRLGGEIAAAWWAVGTTGARMRYVGLVVEGRPAPPARGSFKAGAEAGGGGVGGRGRSRRGDTGKGLESGNLEGAGEGGKAPG